MIARRIVLMTGLALLAACTRGPEVPEAVIEDPRVAVVETVELGRSPGGWIVTARASDPRGTVERLSFTPAGTQDGVLRFNLHGTVTETPAPGLGAMSAQAGLAAMFVPDADLAGIGAIEVRGARGSARAAIPLRAAAQ